MMIVVRLPLLVLLLSLGVFLNAAEITPHDSSEYLRKTIVELENQLSRQPKRVSGSDLKGLDAWVDGSEVKWRSTDLSDIDAQRLSYEVQLKNQQQIRAERDILDMGKSKADIKFASVLEQRLKYRYFSLINYIQQEKRARLLQQQRQVGSSELNNWKLKVTSDEFRPDKLLQADVSLDGIWADELDNRATLNRYKNSFGDSGYATSGSIISIPQMLNYIEHIIQSGAYQHHNAAIQKAELEVGLANKHRQRSAAREKFALSSVKLEYDHKDDDFGASIGVRIPITKNSYDALLEKQDVYYSNVDAQNTVNEVAEQLTQKRFQFFRFQDEWASNQKILHKINTRITRITRSGNVDLLLDLKSHYLKYQQRQNDISIRALRQYIGFLNTAGMLSAKPYRNWLKTGTPRIL